MSHLIEYKILEFYEIMQIQLACIKKIQKELNMIRMNNSFKYPISMSTIIGKCDKNGKINGEYRTKRI